MSLAHGRLRACLALAPAFVLLLALSPQPARSQACADGDVDGICDVDDPCTRDALAEMEGAWLKAAMPGASSASVTLKFRANMRSLPDGGSGNYPADDGVRLLVQSATGATLLDATIPGGAYDRSTKQGWTVVNNPTRNLLAFLYRNVSGNLIGGIDRVSLQRRTDRGDIYRVAVRGKQNTYAVSSGDLPLRLTVVLDPPTATTGNCAETDSPPFACELKGGGTFVLCQ